MGTMGGIGVHSPTNTYTITPHNRYTAVVVQWKRPTACYKGRHKQVPMEMRITHVNMHIHTQELNWF